MAEPTCKKCGSALVVKSKGAFNYAGCPKCISAKEAARQRREGKHGGRPPAVKQTANPPAARKPPEKTVKTPPEKKQPAKAHWLDDYL
jgi:DNA-directed RNA polymerase subunit M/transcription elongation factor TFIIS